MKLAKLFETQKTLDDRIKKEHGLEDQDLIPKKILALLTELGELANEWRGFKFWSKRQYPTSEEVHCIDHKGNIYYRNSLLEEYVDCLHFTLSIGIELAFEETFDFHYSKRNNITEQFLHIHCDLADIRFSAEDKLAYLSLVAHFLGLGEMLGFTWGQIEQAYFEKNKINHDRQREGY